MAKNRTVLRLERALDEAQEANLRLRDDVKAAGLRYAQLQSQHGVEQTKRVFAQRGLVPYVRALEAFDGWLQERPALRRQLEPILRELGLWEIKLGYDPDEDLALSVISPKRK